MPLLALALVLGSLQNPAPDPIQLVKAAIAAEKAQNDKGWKFTFRQDRDQLNYDKNWKLRDQERRTFDVIMLEGENYAKLVLINGKPLDEKTQKKVDDEMEKIRSERRAHSSPRRLVREWRIAGLDDLERLFDNKVTGEEVLNGRKTWRVESEPKKDLKSLSKEDSQITSARRITWFDQEDGMQAKSELQHLRAVEGMQPGSRETTEYTKVGEAWLMASQNMKIEFKAMAVIHAWGETRFRLYDYKRFSVESTIKVE